MSKMKTTKIRGSIAFARNNNKPTSIKTGNKKHPYQTRLSIFITDFEPNANNVGIPNSERENIIGSALHTPLKIDFSGDDYHTHDNAQPIGSIVSVEDNESRILGEAIIWDDLYGEVSEYLKEKESSGGEIATSWEIGYMDEYEEDGVTWLLDTVFLGTAIVDSPAYQERARILAIAENIHSATSEDDKENIFMKPKKADEHIDVQREEITKEASTEEVVETTVPVEEVGEVEATVDGYIELLTNVFTERGYIEQRVYSGHEDIVAAILAFIDEMRVQSENKDTEVASLQEELAALKTKMAEEEQRQKEAALFQERESLLKDYINTEERKNFLVNMSEAEFEIYSNDIIRLATSGSTASKEKKVIAVQTAATKVKEETLSDILKEKLR